MCPCPCRSNRERVAGADRHVPAQDVGSDGSGPGGARLHHRHPRLQLPLLPAHSHEELRPTSGHRCLLPPGALTVLAWSIPFLVLDILRDLSQPILKPTSVVDPGFPEWAPTREGGANLLFGIFFCRKLHENGKKLTKRAHIPRAPGSATELQLRLRGSEGAKILIF